MPISADPRYRRSPAEVLGQRMAYVEVGEGDPIVFLHGNPTSSYLWRNIMPYLEGAGRLIAPDLIGMGDSTKLADSGPDRYTFVEHRRFVEQVLPGAVARTMSEEEMAQYRKPYREPGEARRPTLTWPRQIPIEGEPADVVEIVTDYGHWLPTAPFPKLFVNGDPGAILTGAHRDFCRTWTNQTEITVPGIHFLQEDSPDQIGQQLADWYRTHTESAAL